MIRDSQTALARESTSEPDKRCTSQGATASLAVVEHETLGLGRHVQVEAVQDPARLQAVRLARLVHEVRHKARERFQARDQLLVVQSASDGPAQNARAFAVLVVELEGFFASGGYESADHERA